MFSFLHNTIDFILKNVIILCIINLGVIILKKQYLNLLVCIIFFILCLGVILTYAFVPEFNVDGFASLPQEYKEITAHSALYITGYYDNLNSGAENIKTTQLVLLDEADFIIEILVKEEGYNPTALRKEIFRLKDYENQLYFGIKSFSTTGISYTSIMYTTQRKEEYLKYVHSLTNYTVDEFQ